MTERIARELECSGEFTTELAADPAQRVVDVWWAAHAAARRLHKRVRVRTEARHATTGPSLLITVCLRSPSADDFPADPATDRQEET